MRLADVIAYTNHDLDDALRAGVIKMTDLPKSIIAVLGKTHSKRIDTMVRDVINHSAPTGGAVITGSDEVWEAVSALREFLYERVYESPLVRTDFDKSKGIVATLYRDLKANPHELEKETLRSPRFRPEREAADFVAGMTDRYALNLYARRYMPSPWPGETLFPW